MANVEPNSSESLINLRTATKLGVFLRLSKLDELPQLSNILKGEMSFFWPRPLVKATVEEFRRDFSKIYIIKPGLADYATVKYSFEEKMLNNKNYNSVYNKITLDKIRISNYYLSKLSFKKDFILLFLILRTLSRNFIAAFLEYKNKI